MNEDYDWRSHRQNTQRTHLDYFFNYAQANAKIDPAAHKRLESKLPNLLSAKDFAVKVKAHEVVRDFSYALYGTSHFLEVRGYIREAFNLLEQSVEACREIGDQQGEATHLGNLGLACHDLGDIQKAISHYQQALVIAREIGYRQGEATHLGNLGVAYHAQSDIQKAINYFQEQKAEKIIVATLIMQKDAMRISDQYSNITFYALRISENKYTGKGSTDTGNRLFNTN